MTVGDVNSNARGTGARFNDGKPAFDLIPIMSMQDCARVFDYGRKKYADWNWAKGMKWSVPFACVMRHLAAWQRGEDDDAESGLPHLGHVMCNLVMLSTYAQTYRDGDDRPATFLRLGESAPAPWANYNDDTSESATVDAAAWDAIKATLEPKPYEKLTFAELTARDVTLRSRQEPNGRRLSCS
jgi:hypothetical protein